MFRHRAAGLSYRSIEEATGIRFSTVRAILDSRIYLGEVLHNDQWFPGLHEPILTEAQFHAAHRGFGKGVTRSKDVLSGRVRCGLCTRRMAVAQNGKGSRFYLCRHRGQGCSQPARSTKGLARAAVLGLSLVGHDEQLREAIRRQLAGDKSTNPPPSRGPSAAATLAKLAEDRRKLLELYYAGQITADGFQEEESRLATALVAARERAADERHETRLKSDLELRFDQVAAVLGDLDIEALWQKADDTERRVLVEELLKSVTVFPDHLEVSVSGTPALNVLYDEVGLKVSENVRVGGGT